MTGRFRAILITTTALAALPLGASAHAAETASAEAAALLDGVTITATRSEKRLDEAPATVTVISHERIEDELATDIKDLVRYEAGVSVRNNPARFTAAGSSTGRDGNSGFNIRGIEGNRVLILVDGVRAPDAYSFGAQSMGRGDYLDLETMKSVEILRGPASALYGSDGVAGAVSFVTKDPADYLTAAKPWAFETRLAYASADESWAKSATAAGRSGPWSGLLSYTRRDGSEQENQGSSGARNATRTKPNPQDIVSNAVLAKLVFAPDAHSTVRFTVEHDERKMDAEVLSAIAAPPLASTSVLGLIAQDSLRRDRASLDYRYRGDGWVREAHAAAYWQQSKTNQFSAEDRNTAADRTRIGVFDTRVVGVSLDARSRLTTAGLDHELVYGADYSVTRQEGLRGGTVPPAGETFPTRAFPTTDFTLAGVFLQDEIGFLGGRLKAYPALRYDHYELEPKTGDPLFTGAAPASQSKSHVSPKLGLVLQATPSVGLFANYAEGFKAPAPNQVNNGFANLVSNYRSISNPSLRPETSQTYEGGVRLRGDRWSASATAFSGEYKNFISQVLVAGNFTAANPGLYQFVNLARVKIHGLEGRAQADLGGGFRLNLAAAYAKGSSQSGGVKTPLDSVDPVKVVAGLAWRDSEGRFGGQLIATHSEGKAQSRAGGTCTGGCFTPSAFTLLDATAYWNLTPTVKLRAGVFNITDKKYWWWSDVRGLAQTSTILDAYSQPGRNLAVSLAARF
ncbi:TonB-dependent hemoglobin/transferrin/lactoferrin family receptor [Phenylobacterium sp. LjRoot225]|uniref:TonB-dependent hemoglobin/transferrin/lactoferrin family receptor n=1 Tax=Phenylobacterium sp. LjRoot225 TaxID=3342285 RepID=UPI003ED06139